MDGVFNLLLTQVELLAAGGGVTTPMLCLLFFLGLHWLLTLHMPLTSRSQQGPGKDAPKRDEDFEKHLMEEQGRVLAQSWKTACYYVVHLHVTLILVLIYEFFRAPDVSSFVWLASCMLAYVGLMEPNRRGAPEITARRASSQFACCLFGWMGCLVGCSLGHREDFIVRRDLLMMAQTIMVIIYPNTTVASCFAVCGCAGYVWTTWQVFGAEALTLWFCINQIYQVVIVVLFPAFTQMNHNKCILMGFNSQDADSLVSAFRQVLKAVCDGDLLLDEELKICAGSSCLKRILETPEDATGRAFGDLIAEDGKAVKTFDEFVRDSSKAAQHEGSAPQCLRVALRGSRRLVSADVFHVALPKTLGVSSGRHLLAIAEDADSRSYQTDAEKDSIPSSLLSRILFGRQSRCLPPSVTSLDSGITENIQMFEELSQLTLTLNAGTELIDMPEVVMRFSRRSDEDKIGLGMPSLKKFLRPLDWFPLEAKLRQYARVARKELPAQKKLAPLMFRVPGDSRSFIRARDVTLKSVFNGPRSATQPALLHLTLSNFNEERRKPTTEPSSLTCVEETSQARRILPTEIQE